MVLLIAAELVVRQFNPTPFFIPVNGEPDYQTVNPEYAGRYFQGFTPRVAYNPFLRHKTDSVFRIVTLGGSSTAGYPYPFYSGFPERAAVRLRSIDPTQQIEMINLGMTALSSHVLRDLIPFVIEMNPDAVFIYAGHNEYYGAYGAGGLNRNISLIRILFWLKKSVLFRSLEKIISPPIESDRTMMANSTSDVSITYDGKVYHAGIQNFEANLDAILKTLNERGIKVYIGTLVSNLRGQPPLGVDSTASKAWLNGLDYLAEGDSVTAMTAFMRAKEYDPIRFRAPEEMDQIIYRTAQNHGAQVVNTESYFDSKVMDSLFTDHLHPTALGYDFMAEAFVNVMSDNFGSQSSELTEPAPSPLDAAYARLLIIRLRLGFPFTVGRTVEEELDQFQRIIELHSGSGIVADSLAALAVSAQLPIYEALLEAKNYYLDIADTAKALMHMRSLLYWQPFNDQLHLQGAELASLQTSNLAGEVMQLVVARTPSEVYLNTLAAIRIRQGALGVSGELLRRVESMNPESRVMLFNMARYLVQAGDTLNAETYFRRYQRVVGAEN